MGIELEYLEGQTPLDEDEKDGLLINTVTNKKELDEFEQLNIEKALAWTLSRRWTAKRIFSDDFAREMHQRMYGNTWGWAGNLRQSNKNIGVPYYQVSSALRNLNDDALYWVNHQIYPPDEIAIRFKHRIVAIHCFANGNGRHSRLMADVIISHLFREPVYSWGNSPLLRADDVRKRYINALRSADKGDISPLLAFARS